MESYHYTQLYLNKKDLAVKLSLLKYQFQFNFKMSLKPCQLRL